MEREIKIYVSPNGSDTNDGSVNAAFKTFSRAVDEVRCIIKSGACSPVTVYFFAGTYTVEHELTSEDCNNAGHPVKYCAYGDGEVVFTSGKTISKTSFHAVSEDKKQILSGQARDNVYACDLKKCGIVANGDMFAAKTDPSDVYDCELLCRDKRFTLTRYPRNEFLKIEKLCGGDDEELQMHKKTDPKSEIIILSDELNSKIKGWSSYKEAFLQGYFRFDWCDSTVRIGSIDTEANRMFARGETSGYGIFEGGSYVFRNIFDELNTPGEYYLDKDELMLYVYPFGDIDDMGFSISKNCVIKAKDVSNIIFEDISFKCICGNAIDISGNDCTIKNCTFMGIGKWAITITGERNTIYGCDISHTGKGAILLSGGDRATLTPSGNIVENNYVHDWAEDKWTYCGGVAVSGCGNVIRHNEFTRSPHYAIFYSGNDNIIEYNYIHEVVQQSHDAGAIYGGRDWSAYGNVIRYNLLENIGNENYFPVGIYWDDCQSGQTAFGNIIRNATGKSFLIGGGRDNVVENNLMLESEFPMLFDARGIEGAVANGWYGGTRKNEVNWRTMWSFPITSEIWAKRFPTLATVNDNFDDPDDPQFAPNPTRALVRNNVCVCSNDYGFHVDKCVRKLGTVTNNLIYKDINDCIVENSRYELKPEVKKLLPWFSEIPVDKIGRYK